MFYALESVASISITNKTNNVIVILKKITFLFVAVFTKKFYSKKDYNT